jgi:hypothetical protein
VPAAALEEVRLRLAAVLAFEEGPVVLRKRDPQGTLHLLMASGDAGGAGSSKASSVYLSFGRLHDACFKKRGAVRYARHRLALRPLIDHLTETRGSPHAPDSSG